MYTPYIQTVGSKKEYTLTSTQLFVELGYFLTSTLLVVERDTPSCLHCWLRKEIHSHVQPCLEWRGIHPHVHTVDCGKRFYLTSTLLVVERDRPSYLHCWIRKEIHSHVRPGWWWKGIHPNIHTDNTPLCPHCWLTLTFTPCWWWKRINNPIHTHTQWLWFREKKTSSLHTAGGVE